MTVFTQSLHPTTAHEENARGEEAFYRRLAAQPFRTFSTTWARHQTLRGMGWFETLPPSDGNALTLVMRESVTAAIPAWHVYAFGKLHRAPEPVEWEKRPARRGSAVEIYTHAQSITSMEAASLLRAEVVRTVRGLKQHAQREAVAAMITLCDLSPPGTDVLGAMLRLHGIDEVRVLRELGFWTP